MKSVFILTVIWLQVSILLLDRATLSNGENIPSAVIILLVTGNFYELRRCMNAIVRHKENTEQLLQPIVFVNDGSTGDAVEYQRKLCESDPSGFHCVSGQRRETNQPMHYAASMNEGLKYINTHLPSTNTNDVVIFLRVNTVVSDNWLSQLYEAAIKDLNVGFVGPISNIAGHQSVPYPHDAKHAEQEPAGLSISHLAKELKLFVEREQIQPVPMNALHNFCLMVRRRALDKICGSFDAVNYPLDSGAERELLLRAHSAGYVNYVVPSSYVYHIKHSSSQYDAAEKPNSLASAGSSTIDSNKQLSKLYGDAAKVHHHVDAEGHKTEGVVLAKVAKFVETYYHHMELRYPYALEKGSILFVLHDVAVGGGIISILQESLTMFRMGIHVRVSVPKDAAGGKAMDLVQSILPNAEPSVLQQLIIRHDGSTFHPQPFSQDFMRVAQQFDIVIATYCLTMRSVETVANAHRNILPAYYVQDYEPWTWYSPFTPKNDPNSYWAKEARYTYTANSGRTFMFAKTHWTSHTVNRIHNVTVHRVAPSIDQDVYYPDKAAVARKHRKTFEGVQRQQSGVERFQMLAMIRPRTPRRNPENTMEVMLRLAFEYKNVVDVHLFGSKPEEMLTTLSNLKAARGEAPYRTAEFLQQSENVHILGLVVERTEIANLNRMLDVFIDLSWWQAFGRAGLEAMACGSVAVMPLTGAAPDICKNQEFCLYHDGNDVEGYYQKVVALLKNDTKRHELIDKGMRKAQHFYLEWAAASIANAVHRGLGEHRKQPH